VGFGLPTNVCVGDFDLPPSKVATDYGSGSPSRVGSRERVTPSNRNIRIAGDDSAADLLHIYDAPAARGRAQQASEKWVPGSGVSASVRTVDAGPLGCAGGDYNKNLDSREA